MQHEAAGARQQIAHHLVELPLALGFVAGTLTVFLGIGGGFILVPAMLYVLGMSAGVVVGTSLALAAADFLAARYVGDAQGAAVGELGVEIDRAARLDGRLGRQPIGTTRRRATSVRARVRRLYRIAVCVPVQFRFIG